jgi:3-oxoacyl-[acyl-carrier protein] reductase
MDLGIDQKRAAVAGASSGLGFATAAALVDAGVQVVICGRDRDRIDAAAARLGPWATRVVAYVGSAEGGRHFVAEAVERLGGLDILVPNAGGPPPGDFASTDLDAYAPALELNLLSVVGMCTEALPHLQAQRWGRIVAITSISVRQPIPNLILSNTARAGVTGFLKTLALEVAGDGITVNSVLPGLHDTDRLRGLYGGGDPSALATGIPAGVIGRPEDFGAVVAFLCSDAARFITGAAIPVDGGTNRALL